MKPVPLIAVLFISLFIQGCTNLSYYSQSITGQLSLMMKRNDIGDLVKDRELDEVTKTKLQQVLKIRSFASSELLLPDNDSYKTYANLGRPFAVWNVFVASRLSVKPKTWCFPVAGCVPYRGYFSKEAAEEFANIYRELGYDVHVGGITAYSTLGWFDDPVLNTFLKFPEPRLAGLIFHELAHQQLYVKDDSTFNESFATAVEMEGVRRWLDKQPEQFRQYDKGKQMHAEFIALLIQTRDQLDSIYNGELSNDVKLYQKQLIFEQLKKRYDKMKLKWKDNRYDNWFKHDLNNARLATVGTYHDYVPAFRAMLAEQNGDLGKFYIEAKNLAGLDKDDRTRKLRAMTATQSRRASLR